MIDNLWPVFDTSRTKRSPKTVIDEAGRGLKNRTGGNVRFLQTGSLVRDDKIDIEYSLYSTALDYHYPFLRAIFPVGSPSYPVRIVADKQPDSKAEDEQELIDTLRSIFNAQTTIETVETLMSFAEVDLASS